MTAIFDSGPINIQQGNSATFTIEFLSSIGTLTVPSSGNLTMTYIDINNTPVVESVDLTPINSFFTCTWSSTSAALGLADWNITAAGSTVSQSVGQLRIIQRQSTY